MPSDIDKLIASVDAAAKLGEKATDAATRQGVRR